MSALVLDVPMRPSIFDLVPQDPAVPARGFADASLRGSGDGLTFDDLIVGAWEGLSAHRVIDCPACGGAMAPRRIVGQHLHGLCGGCGAELS